MTLELNLTAIYEQIAEDSYIGYIVEIPSINMHGETIDEVREYIASAIQKILKVDYCSLEFKADSPFYFIPNSKRLGA